MIGAGHNGLTTASYLALGSLRRSPRTEPPRRRRRCHRRNRSWFSLFSLQLPAKPAATFHYPGAGAIKARYEASPAEPSSFTPCLDGRSLLLGGGVELNYLENVKFLNKDVATYPRYEEQLLKFCYFMDSLLDSHTPEFKRDAPSLMAQVKDKCEKSVFWTHLLHQALTLGQKDMLDFMDLLASPATKALNSWFETGGFEANTKAGLDFSELLLSRPSLFYSS